VEAEEVEEDEESERLASREKSSRDAGSEGEYVMSGDACPARLLVVVSSVSLSLVFWNDRDVGRFGVDLDWKPEGAGAGLRGGTGWPFPLLWGGIVSVAVELNRPRACQRVQVHIERSRELEDRT